MKPILKWQYDQIIKELLLLQEHQTDPTCPCQTDGEMCVRKHLMTLEAYAQETIPMEENEEFKDKLQMLAGEAKEYRKQEEAALRDEDVPVSLVEWTRNWRKAFEEHSLEPQEEDMALTNKNDAQQ
ncbi:hypothetical protein [Dethiobacter alkaliphilus]|uniref:hypothetical protein n=1 Tax=Dethiobacter alkaliphilus TaxID=427926 RepID=UPI0022260B61|nr:hypothetical protein [Dethiobacter alkaliphilus]MCW3489281.1 hypothetical protein [Dethiobacter alkaliphilus]